MPERSFGRTVRYRRTKLGLSQAKLGELVGRSTATIRSWERDKSRPTDPKVLSTLAAILGVNEPHLFDKADVDRPQVEETSPTVEEALATLGPQQSEQLELEGSEDDTTDDPVDVEPFPMEEPVPTGEPVPMEEPVPMGEPVPDVAAADETEEEPEGEQASEDEEEPAAPRDATVRQLVGASAPAAYVAPPEPYVRTPPTPSLADASYIEDSSQRQMYRVRTLATLVGLVALVVALIWALQEGVGALDAWWDDFFGNLRL